MACKLEAPIVTMVAAVCERALSELDAGNPDLAPLVSQLEKTRDEATGAAEKVGVCADARGARQSTA
jgi:hypothetical protein